MTINEAHLDALIATITLTYIPVMTPGLYDTFPAHPEIFPGHIGWFRGPFLVEIWTFKHRLAQETIQYGQEMSQDWQETCHRVQES